MVLFVALGSFFALLSSPADAVYHIEQELSGLRVALGGFCIILGARLADGCTSGHGITGMGHLALRSMVAVSTRAACQPAFVLAFSPAACVLV